MYFPPVNTPACTVECVTYDAFPSLHAGARALAHDMCDDRGGEEGGVGAT